MNSLITKLEEQNPFNSTLIFARALLAFGTLMTLISNDISTLLNRDVLLHGAIYESRFLIVEHISIFKITTPLWGKTACIIILLFVISGFLPRISCILHAWVSLSICNSITVLDGGDQVTSNITLLLLPVCILDRRVNAWIINNETVAPLRNIFCNTFFFLVKLQMAVIYLHAATGKLGQEEWLTGTPLYYWFTHNTFGASPSIYTVIEFFTLSKYTPVLTWSVLFLELGLFACILATDKGIKQIFLFLGIGFHFMIIVIHGLPSFFFAMLAGLLLYLDKEGSVANALSSRARNIWPAGKPKPVVVRSETSY